MNNIPNVNKYLLSYLFENLKIHHKPRTLWLEFGVGSGFTINYISKFTTDVVYGFDTLEELQKRWTDDNIIVTPDILPDINNNVDLIIGNFLDTLEKFIIKKNMLISFIHIDLNSYSLTSYILDIVKEYINHGCIILFGHLINYEINSQFIAFDEFIYKNRLRYKWIGTNGLVDKIGILNYPNHEVAVIIHRM